MLGSMLGVLLSTAAIFHRCAHTQTVHSTNTGSRFLSTWSSIGHLAVTKKHDYVAMSVAGNSSWLDRLLPCDSLCADDSSTVFLHGQYIDQPVRLKCLSSFSCVRCQMSERLDTPASQSKSFGYNTCQHKQSAGMGLLCQLITSHY